MPSEQAPSSAKKPSHSFQFHKQAAFATGSSPDRGQDNWDTEDGVVMTSYCICSSCSKHPNLTDRYTGSVHFGTNGQTTETVHSPGTHPATYEQWTTQISPGDSSSSTLQASHTASSSSSQTPATRTGGKGGHGTEGGTQ